LTDEQRDALRSAMTSVICESQIGRPKEDGSVPGLCGLADFNSKLRTHQPVRLDADQREAIEKSNLNDWEKAVLEGYLSGHWGWQTQVAEEFGKSRAAPGKTMRLLKNKILRNYGEAA